MNKRNVILFFVFSTLVIVVFLLQLLLGSVSIPFFEVVNIIFHNTSQNEVWKNILWQSRFPAALAALLAGAGLSVSGLQMQTMFRNPVAGPYVLGISAGDRKSGG